MVLGFFGSGYLTWVFITWLPGCLEIERHMTTITTGVAAGIPFACGFVGSLVAGWFSDHLIRRGMSPADARAAALRGFGGIAYQKERVRDVRGTRAIEEFVGDLLFVVRSLRRAPGFTVAVIVTG